MILKNCELFLHFLNRKQFNFTVMEMKFKAKIILLFIILFQASEGFGQILIETTSENERIKNGTTYVILKDSTTDKIKQYMDVLKKYWTHSKIEFISFSEIDKNMGPENSYLMFGSTTNTTTSVRTGSFGFQREGVSSSCTYIYLELFTIKQEVFKAKRKKYKFNYKDKIRIARIDLFTDFDAVQNVDLIFKSNFDGNGHIYNWGPGFLKNNVQTLMGYLRKNEVVQLKNEIENDIELKNLKTETLYVPSYTMIKYNKFNGNESKSHDEEDIFEDYKNKYKIISTEELNNKILSETKPFYYLVYIRSCTQKFINVVNSSTGEIIYSEYNAISYNMKTKDLRKLYKKTQ
jgi:hypothetical protein